MRNSAYATKLCWSWFALLELPPNHEHVELIQIVEAHLVPVAPEEDELVANHHSRVAVPSAGSFASHYIGVVYQRLHKLGLRGPAEFHDLGGPSRGFVGGAD